MAPWIVWLVIGALLIIAEMATLTFHLLWLGIGALAAMVVSLIAPDLIWLQTLVGCFVALLLTLFTKPLTRRFRAASKGYKNAFDDIVGKKGQVVEEIAVGQLGMVKIDNEIWSATANEKIAAGEAVIVVRRGSAVLEVQKWGGI